VAQEIAELEGIISASEERIKLLKELQETLDVGGELPLSDTHVRALREKVPLLSEIASNPSRIPTATAEDYLISKAVVPMDQEVSFVRLMPLRTNRPSSSSSHASTSTPLPSALVVAAQKDGTVRLFTPSGELALSFSAGHEQPITRLAVSPSHEEYLVATCDDSGSIRVHRINVRQRKLGKDEKMARKLSAVEKVSVHLGLAVNVTAQLQKQMQVPQDSEGDAPKITALALTSQGGTKYLLAGDIEGKISVFSRNATLRARVDTTSVPGVGVDSISVTLGSALFRSGREWGYLDLERMEARHLECHGFTGQISAAILDSQQSTRVIAADEEGTVWVFNVKNKRECRVELQFPRGATLPPLDLASTRGFAIGVEQSSPGKAVSVLALNMSQVTKNRPGSNTRLPDTPPPPPENSIVWRRTRPAMRAWSLLKRAKEGDLLAFLAEDGREIEIMELLMTASAPPPADNFSNFKMPVIAVAVVLVLGYQYMKQKGKGGLGGGGGARKFDDGSDFAAMLRNKKKLSALKGKKF